MNRVLIVEDEEFLIRALEDNLVADGYAVDIAKNGEEAVRKIRKKKPDLILLDILMPGSDGFYVIKEIKRSPIWKSIPVIVLSNLGEDTAIKRALEVGADDYFVKSQHPIQEVIKRVEDYLEGRRGTKRRSCPCYKK
ncbi:MAG: response regulator [Candidatus Paceibacterota bacterium]